MVMDIEREKQSLLLKLNLDITSMVIMNLNQDIIIMDFTKITIIIVYEFYSSNRFANV